MARMSQTNQSKVSRKILVITYYWPPAGGPGVQRVVKFVKFLPHFGYEPIVLTVKDGEYPAIDHSLQAEVSSEVNVIRTPTLEFFSLFKKLTGRPQKAGITTTILKAENPSWKDKIFRWIRYNLFFPDARIGWRRYALRAARQIIQSEKPVLIFCTSPPHSAQWIARQLHQETKIPWVADFRDPWTDAYWLSGLKNYPRALRKNTAMEKAVLSDASAIVTVSKGYQELLQKTNNSPILIRNGFDHTDFRIQKKANAKFRIVYTGSLSQIQMPDNFLKAIANLDSSVQENIQFDLFGAIDPFFFHRATELGIRHLVHEKGYIPHDQAVGEMIQADLLLLLTPKTPSKGMTPLKLYEYLAAGPFILGIGDVNSDPANILQAFEGGIYVSYQEELTAFLNNQFKEWKQNPEKIRTPNARVTELDRKELTRKLASVFDDIIDKEQANG
ncbi:MAG: glycosyltransferase family 4 protein [Saprospiraceae bacterium]|nr:glycosyltransferase family 4 protein [Saprospiraceae bacterium]